MTPEIRNPKPETRNPKPLWQDDIVAEANILLVSHTPTDLVHLFSTIVARMPNLAWVLCPASVWRLIRGIVFNVQIVSVH